MKKIFAGLIVSLFAVLPLFSSEAGLTDEEMAASIEVQEEQYLAVDADEAEQAEPEMPQIKEHTVFTGFVNIRAGYSLVSLKGVNDFISAHIAMADITGAQVLSEKRMEGAGTVGIDIGLMPFGALPLSAGMKIAYISCNNASSETSLGGVREKYGFESSAVPIMAGASYELGIPGIPVSFIADAYFGYVFAGGLLSREDSSTVREEAMFGGGGFAVETGLKINYRILDALSAGLNIAYIFANAGEMKYSSDATLGPLEVKKGGKVVNFQSGDGKMEFDYSGLLIGINANMLY